MIQARPEEERMILLGFGRITLCICVAAAILGGCGGSQPPIGAPGVMPQLPGTATHGTSWMLSEAKSKDLLYVTDVRAVTVYSYPKGKVEGKLKGFYIAYGACADKKGDVFIVDGGYYKIFEYAHGGTKRIATLDSSTDDPNGCAIDPTTGNLAVASLGFGSDGSIEIYKNARGIPTTYRDSTFQEYWLCGYDNKGNLFVDGQDYEVNFIFAELPRGSSTLKTLTLNQNIGWPGGVQWDGKYVAVGDQNTPVVYQFAIKGSQGTKKGATTMGSGASVVDQYFIDGQTLIAPNQLVGSDSDVLFYKYPSGGDATKIITKDVRAAHGVVVSDAAK